MAKRLAAVQRIYTRLQVILIRINVALNALYLSVKAPAAPMTSRRSVSRSYHPNEQSWSCDHCQWNADISIPARERQPFDMYGPFEHLLMDSAGPFILPDIIFPLASHLSYLVPISPRARLGCWSWWITLRRSPSSLWSRSICS